MHRSERAELAPARRLPRWLHCRLRPSDSWCTQAGARCWVAAAAAPRVLRQPHGGSVGFVGLISRAVIQCSARLWAVELLGLPSSRCVVSCAGLTLPAVC